MSDFHRSSSSRLIQLLALALLTMSGLAMLWAFKLEPRLLGWAGIPANAGPSLGQRWGFVAVATLCALLSMVVPVLLLKRLARNTRASYRRLKSLQNQTEALAGHDALTGLFNRRIFMEKLRDRLSQIEPCVVMLIDLDRFKAINDTFGHHLGDRVLVEVGNRLQRIARDHDGSAARLGGDEFCLLFLAKKDKAELAHIASAVIAAVSAPNLTGEEGAQLGATIGISRSWVDAHEASTLLHFADIAMYRGKKDGRSTYNFYDPEFEREGRAQAEADLAVKKALEREQIVPFFQPIVALPSETVVGYEILARWLKPDGSIGLPADFMPSLERLGLIPAMTRCLLKQACAAAREWDSQLTLSLNVTAAMITDELFPDRLLERLRCEGIAFDRFEVEITEEALVGNLAAAQRNLNKLQANGITVALDDFGTGYSGLYHLTRLSIDKIKIDRSFFEPGHTNHLPMVEAILGMARSLKMKVTAEGIEACHLPSLPSWLAGNGCDYAQGYLYGEPQPGVSQWERPTVAGRALGERRPC